MNFNRGNSITPVEDFILGLSRRWEDAMERGRGLNPDDIISDIEAPSDGCREWFDDAVAITRDFNNRYAHVINADDKAGA
jgi:uncharacterized protein YeaO (DUF488 family)